MNLICWDLVSQVPSTPGAWIGMIEELKPYMESESKDKTKLLERFNTFNTWLD